MAILRKQNGCSVVSHGIPSSVPNPKFGMSLNQTSQLPLKARHKSNPIHLLFSKLTGPFISESSAPHLLLKKKHHFSRSAERFSFLPSHLSASSRLPGWIQAGHASSPKSKTAPTKKTGQNTSPLISHQIKGEFGLQRGQNMTSI